MRSSAPTPLPPFRPGVYYGVGAILFIAHFVATVALGGQGIGMLLNLPGVCISGQSDVMSVLGLCLSSFCWGWAGVTILSGLFPRERVAIAVALLLLTASLVMAGAAHANANRLQAEIAAAVSDAKRELPTGATYAEARAYLRTHGYFVYMDGPDYQEQENVTRGNQPGVQGWRRLHENKFASGEAWMDLIVLMDKDGHYEEVEADLRPLTPFFRSEMNRAGYSDAR